MWASNFYLSWPDLCEDWGKSIHACNSRRIFTMLRSNTQPLWLTKGFHGTIHSVSSINTLFFVVSFYIFFMNNGIFLLVLFMEILYLIGNLSRNQKCTQHSYVRKAIFRWTRRRVKENDKGGGGTEKSRENGNGFQLLGVSKSRRFAPAIRVQIIQVQTDNCLIPKKRVFL